MDKVIAITGASSGIGAATARAAVAAGWKAALLARRAEKLESLCGELGDAAVAIPCDVSDPEATKAAMGEAAGRWGRLDAVFANAGLGTTASGTEGGDVDNWRTMVEVNCFGVLTTAKAALPHLRETKGTFLITGSRAGRSTMAGSVYGATKWFVRGYAANLHEEMKEWGGRCALIAPGMVDTPFFDDPKPDALKPEDVAGAAMYALTQPPHVSIGEVLITPMR